MNNLSDDEKCSNQKGHKQNLFFKSSIQMDENICDEDFYTNPKKSSTISSKTNGSKQAISSIENTDLENPDLLEKVFDEIDMENFHTIKNCQLDKSIDLKNLENEENDHSENNYQDQTTKDSLNNLLDSEKEINNSLANVFFNQLTENKINEFKTKSELNIKNKNKITKKIKKTNNKEKETNKIEINKKSRKKKVFKEQKYAYKNFCQYLGKKVFSLFKFNDSLEKYLSEKYKNPINKTKLEEWIILNDLKRNYRNLKNFREMWIFNENTDRREQQFKMVLRKVTKNLLRDHLTRQIMEDSKNKKYKVYNLKSFLECIPTFLYGIKNPNLFYNIKEFNNIL